MPDAGDDVLGALSFGFVGVPGSAMMEETVSMEEDIVEERLLCNDGICKKCQVSQGRGQAQR